MSEPVMGSQGDVLGQRIVAVIIDGIINAVISLPIIFVLVLGILGAGGSEQVASLAGYITTPIMLVYYIVLEGLYGKTLGKMAMSIMVVKENGSECGWDGSLIRNVLRPVDALFGYLVGLITILASTDSQRVGDHAASTMVVKTE